MTPFDISVGADLAGAPPLVVLNGEQVEVEPDRSLPRFSLAGDFLFPSNSPIVNTVVSVVVTEWSASYTLGIPYEASVVETGIDLAFRAFPFDEPGESYTGVHVRPWGEIGIGGRGVGLFHSWWNDIGQVGLAIRAGAGVTVGGRHQHLVLGARYEAILSGNGIKGILDSAVQDMKWIWTPSSGRVFVTLGGGWR